MQSLIHVIKCGWPNKKQSLPEVVKPYYSIREELIVQDNLIFKGNQVVIPQEL